MTDRTLEVQKAVRAVLIGDSTLMTTLGINAVYDTPSTSAEFPYITVGDITTTPKEVKDQPWLDYRMNIGVWVKSPSKESTKDILSRLYDLLHQTTIVLDSGYEPAVYVVQTLTQTDPDGMTQHGICMIRVQD